MPGILYIVPTPIGNFEDITLRALEVLKNTDLIVCEELKEARKLLKHYQIEKPLEPLNEHNEEKQSAELVKKLRSGAKIALIADCGTPVIADPGSILIAACLRLGIKIIPLPGPSSLTAALSASGLRLDQFYYLGLLPAKTAERREKLRKIKKIPLPVIIMDTPYRLMPLLRDIILILGEEKEIYIAYNLTLPDEEILWGQAEGILRHLQSKGKGEFVLIIPPTIKPEKAFSQPDRLFFPTGKGRASRKA